MIQSFFIVLTLNLGVKILTSSSHIIPCKGCGAGKEMHNNVWITDHWKQTALRLIFHFYPDITAEGAEVGTSRKRKLNTRSIILVTTSNHLTGEGTDYGSARFSHMRQETDGFHIKRLQTCQWPFIKSWKKEKKNMGLRWHSVRKEKRFKMTWFPIGLCNQSVAGEETYSQIYLPWVWMASSVPGLMSVK